MSTNTNTAKIPTPKTGVICYYDFTKEKIAVKGKNGRTRLVENVAVRNVEFTVEEGYRDGCAPTGNLGYIKGNIASQADLTNPVKLTWNGDRFVEQETGKDAAAPKQLLLVGKTMIGFYPS